VLVETDVASSERVNCTAALLTRAIDRDGQWWWYEQKSGNTSRSLRFLYAACLAGGFEPSSQKVEKTLSRPMWRIEVGHVLFHARNPIEE